MATLIISGRLDGLNDYTKACRTAPIVGAQMKKKNESIITAAIYQQGLMNMNIERVELKFRWYEKSKRRDLDNICFAKKFILDSLVNSRVIQTDDWRGVKGFTDEFFTDKANPRIEVEIKEVEN